MPDLKGNLLKGGHMQSFFKEITPFWRALLKLAYYYLPLNNKRHMNKREGDAWTLYALRAFLISILYPMASAHGSMRVDVWNPQQSSMNMIL